MQIGISTGLAARRSGGPIWTPADNFPLGAEPGFWLDPTSFANIYQDSAGTSPATAVEQPAGRVLDKSGRGNHFSQATSTSRPKISARVNLLTKTEQFNDAAWVNAAGTVNVIPNAVTAPDGTLTADKLVPAAAASWMVKRQDSAITSGTAVQAVYAREGDAGVHLELFVSASIGAIFNLSTGATIASSGCTVAVGLLDAYNFRRYEIRYTAAVSQLVDVRLTTTSTRDTQMAGDGSKGAFVWGAQLQTGPVATRYQRVNTATDYDAAGFVQALGIDGLDDTIATSPAAFGASMDVFLAVRRTSATGVLLFATAGGGQYLGAMDATAGPASSGAGTPTYLVNGVAVPGGTATTRAQLAAAIPLNQWCVFEALGIDMSMWPSAAIGAHAALPMGMGFAQGIAYPSGDTATRAKNRRFAGAKVGLTL